MSGKAKFRLLLLLAMAGVTGYVGFLVFKERDPLPPLVAAERAYDEGRSFERQENFKEAASKYDQASVLLEHARKRLDGPHGMDEEHAKDAAGRIYLLKSRALRDKYYALSYAAYAEAPADKKPAPLAEAMDSVTGEKFRNILAIPDTKDREEAGGSLRGAAVHFLQKDFDVQMDALRLALMVSPIRWDEVEKYCKAILEIRPDESRAKYLLAKIDFEQPEQNTNRPVSPEKRSPERIKSALRLIDEVRTDLKFPIWRTEHLKANIHQALLKGHAKNREKEYLEELDILDRILLDESNGALAKIRDNYKLERLGSWDSEGVLALQTMAAEVAMEEIRRKRVDPSVLGRVYEDTLAFCTKKFATPDPWFPRPIVIGTLLDMMSVSQSMLAMQEPKKWQAGLNSLRPILKEEFQNDRCDPWRVAQFAELLVREALVESRRQPSDKKKADDLRAEAKKWLDDGLRFGKEHGFSNVQMLPFNLLAANVSYFNGDKREDVAPFLAALQETRIPQAQATALVIDGAFDEREGRLEKAREKLERAIKITGGDEDVRAHATLANIYMAMGRPDHALVSLINLQNIYARYNDLTLQEKEWLTVFLRSPNDYFALTAIASLESARRAIANHFQKNPRAKNFPPDLVKEQETRVRGLLDQELSSPVTGPGFITRTSWIYYLSVTNRRREADEELQKLAQAFPDRLELLSLKIGMMERDAQATGDPAKVQAMQAAADKIILSFISTYSANQAAQLYYATWLAQTRRNEQALDYLNKILKASNITPDVRRTAMAILLSTDRGLSPNLVAGNLARDPKINAALVGLTFNSDKQKAEVRGALSRFEAVGLSRALEAEDLYLAGEYAKAADAFAAALDFTRIKSLAEQGLLRSMIGLAHKDPEVALNSIRQITASFPNEPMVLLAYAYVFLVRDEIGLPNDDWEHRRNMGSALNVWELNLTRQALDNPVAIALTRAEFWFRANRIDVALTQAQRALNHDRQNLKVLSTCIGMIVDDPAKDPKPELREYLEELKRLAPDNPGTKRMLARAAELAQDWPKAIDFNEQAISLQPKDRDSYAHLVALLDHNGEPDRALKWARAWRGQLPDDVKAAAAEVRMLAKMNDMAKARDVANDFSQYAQNQAAKLVDPLKDPAERAKRVEDARWLIQIELARGFFVGGAVNEADVRLQQLPKSYYNLPVAQELLAEVYLKQKDWPKAEAVLESIVQKNPRNLMAVNNLAYVLTAHANKPSHARDLILTALKSGPRSLSTRSADRLPPEFLATIGSVYTKLGKAEYGREMLDFFGTAARRYPNDPRVKLYMGYGFELTGEHRRAIEFYDQAVASAGHPALSHGQRDSLLREAERLKILSQANQNQVGP